MKNSQPEEGLRKATCAVSSLTAMGSSALKKPLGSGYLAPFSPELKFSLANMSLRVDRPYTESYRSKMPPLCNPPAATLSEGLKKMRAADTWVSSRTEQGREWMAEEAEGTVPLTWRKD